MFFLKEGVTVLVGDSGIGKSLLLNSVNYFCYRNDVSRRKIDSKLENVSSSQIIDLCEDVEVILLDNADLYLTPELLQTLSLKAKYLILSIKNYAITYYQKCNRGKVYYNDKLVTLEDL